MEYNNYAIVMGNILSDFLISEKRICQKGVDGIGVKVFNGSPY